MSHPSRYDQIKKIIDEEIDEIIAEHEEPFDGEREKEMYRDEMIERYLHHLKEDLQSDNAD